MKKIHECHSTRCHVLDNFEDSTNEAAVKWVKREVEKVRVREEIVRNRERVLEINHFVDHMRKLVEEEELKQEVDGDDDDDDDDGDDDGDDENDEDADDNDDGIVGVDGDVVEDGGGVDDVVS